MAAEESELPKVGIFRNNNELVLTGILPDNFIFGALKSDIAHMDRAWIEVGQQIALGGERGSDRRAVSSRWDGQQSPLPIRRECQARSDVFAREIGKISEDFILSHSRSEVLENGVDRPRRPRIQGFPPRFPGSIVIKCW